MDPTQLLSELRTKLLSFHCASHATERLMDVMYPKYEHSECLQFLIPERQTHH